MCVKVIFLDVVFNDEKNDTLVGSLRAILPDLNVSTTQSCHHEDASSALWALLCDITKKGKIRLYTTQRGHC